MFIWSKLGENLLKMEVRTFARIKKVISDQLLVTKAEIIPKLYFRFACISPRSQYRLAVKVSDYILCRAWINITIAWFKVIFPLNPTLWYNQTKIYFTHNKENSINNIVRALLFQQLLANKHHKLRDSKSSWLYGRVEEWASRPKN